MIEPIRNSADSADGKPAISPHFVKAGATDGRILADPPAGGGVLLHQFFRVRDNYDAGVGKRPLAQFRHDERFSGGDRHFGVCCYFLGVGESINGF
jgi:hypothetical protein